MQATLSRTARVANWSRIPSSSSTANMGRGCPELVYKVRLNAATQFFSSEGVSPNARSSFHIDTLSTISSRKSSSTASITACLSGK